MIEIFILLSKKILKLIFSINNWRMYIIKKNQTKSKYFLAKKRALD